MKKELIKFTFIGALVVAALSSGCSTMSGGSMSQNGAYASPQPDTNGQTLANLQEAFNGESNASAKYLEYAKKADAEGYTKVASLFRAASFAESVHLKNHAEVIKKMGGTPKADVKLPEIKTTAENLKEAIAGESYERDTMYTDFMLEARRTGNKEALRSFNFAKIAEAEHARLYGQALANLEQWKGEKTTYFVCRTCGWTTADSTLKKCPVDFTPKENFEEVN